MSILMNEKVRATLAVANSKEETRMSDQEFFDHIQKVNEELKKNNPSAKEITIYAGKIDPKIYSGPSTQAENNSEASSKYVSNEAKVLSKIIKGDIVSDVEAPDFFKGVDSLMKKVDEVVGDPNTPDTPMAEAFRNANKNRNRNRNRGHGRGHHD